MRKKSKLPNTKKQHCKNCGHVTHFSDKVGGYLELKPEQISPWRCENCGAVYEFNVEGDPSSGYRLANDPDKEKREQEARDTKAAEEAKSRQPQRNRREWRLLKRKKGKSKHTRKKGK